MDTLCYKYLEILNEIELLNIAIMRSWKIYQHLLYLSIIKIKGEMQSGDFTTKVKRKYSNRKN